MWYLLVVTLLWGSSFSLTGHFLAGQVDGFFAVFIRTAAAFLLFLPFTRWRSLPPRLMLGLWVCGALQFGLTYALAFESFSFLTVPEMLLFTTLTPLYISLINHALARKFSASTLLAALVAVAGGIVIHYQPLSGEFWYGFWILQLANICFASGQVLCRRLLLYYSSEKLLFRLFGHFFFGAVLLTGLLYYFLGNKQMLPHTELQWGILLYLSVVATALGSLWLAIGSLRVNITTIAIFNELHVPIGLLINLVFWGSKVPWLRLLLGCILITTAMAINYYSSQNNKASITSID